MNFAINTILKFILTHWRLVGFVLIILVIVTYFSCWNSGLEAELNREKEARSTEQQADIDEAQVEVNKSANESNQARVNTQQIENANFNGTNITEANRLRCKAFPERCK